MSVSPRPSRFGLLSLSAIAGVLIGLAGILVIIAVRGRDPSPEFTRAEFEAARERWRSAGPTSYDLEVEVVGQQPAVYRVEVRQGEVVLATIDGRPLKQRRTFDTWTVPGMFDTMERDVENLELVAAGRAKQETPRLTLRATFDPVLGFPQRYRRIEWGASRDMVWEVREFKSVQVAAP